MIVNVRQGLNSFLRDRKERFLNVTVQQKEEWIKGIEEYISETMDDNDVYYDHMPESVEENIDAEDEVD
jgi:N-glycosylase/DNA lyase